MGRAFREEEEAAFLDWLRAKGNAEETVLLRRSGLRNFARWYLLTRGKQPLTSEVAGGDIEAYAEYLWGARRSSPGRRRLAGGTIRAYLDGMRMFLEWARTAR